MSISARNWYLKMGDIMAQSKLNKLRDEINLERKNEILKIKAALQKAGYSCQAQVGEGRKDYTSGLTMNPFDLSYWKWLSFYDNESMKNGKDTEYNIYFQSADTDTGSGNNHTLIDRLAVGYSSKSKRQSNIQRTNFDLPLSEENIERLIIYIKTFIKGQVELSEI